VSAADIPLDEQRSALAAYFTAASGARGGEVTAMQRLSGGAIQENWLLRVVMDGGSLDGEHELVLRTDAPSSVAASHGRDREFALLSAASQAGVTVPEPLWLNEDLSIIGRPFFVMRKVGGTAAAHRIVREAGLGGDRRQLTRRLGAELARIHSIRPPRADLGFLGTPPLDTPQHAIERARRQLQAQPRQRPALEWGLHWLAQHAASLPRQPVVLAHRDFRTGNYMVDEHGLTGVLDWEFAAWGDPLEDIGWLCARCWRFGSGAEVGGVGTREDLHQGYREAGGDAVLDAAAIRWWEVMAHINWALIALQQYERHASGEEPSLLLALTGTMVPELEHEVLLMTGEA
jgi:aminoglycoside phosphotransferase (APT) family kinase protein